MMGLCLVSEFQGRYSLGGTYLQSIWNENNEIGNFCC